MPLPCNLMRKLDLGSWSVFPPVPPSLTWVLALQKAPLDLSRPQVAGILTAHHSQAVQ